MNTIQVEKIQTLTGHNDCLYTLEKIDDQNFVSAGGDGVVAKWNLEELGDGAMIAKVPSSIYALSYQESNGLLVVGQNFSGVHLIDVDAKKEVGSLALTKSSIFDIQADKDFIRVACGDGTLFVLNWNLQVVSKQTLSEKSVRTLAMHPNGNELAVGYSDNMIRIFEPNSLLLKKEIEAHKISVFTLKYHPQLPLLVSGSRDAKLKFWDIQHDYQLVEEVAAHMYAINDLYFSPDGQYFVSCSMDKSIKVWNANTFKLLKVIDKSRHAGHGTSVNKLLWMPFNNWLVSCSDDRTISIWDVNFAE